MKHVEKYNKYQLVLDPAEIKAGIVNLDPERVCQVWNLDERDYSGTMFHLLKHMYKFELDAKDTTNTKKQLVDMRHLIYGIWQLFIGFYPHENEGEDQEFVDIMNKDIDTLDEKFLESYEEYQKITSLF